MKGYLIVAVAAALSIERAARLGAPDESWMRSPADWKKDNPTTHGPQKKGKKGKKRRW